MWWWERLSNEEAIWYQPPEPPRPEMLDQRLWVQQNLWRLPPRQDQAIALTLIGLSLRAIARQMACSKSNLRRLIAVGTHTLKTLRETKHP